MLTVRKVLAHERMEPAASIRDGQVLLLRRIDALKMVVGLIC